VRWRIAVTATARKSLQRLSRPDRERIVRAIDALPAGDVRPMVGLPDERRLRVGGWRVRYRRDDVDHLLTILVVAPRGDVCKS
jgi:mRNA-degrading endonuclease RelE of RelBE toxin-antitoxin system